MLKLGLVSAILADKTLEEVIDFAAQHQFTCIEVMCWPPGKAERRYAGVTHLNVNALDDQAVTHIHNYLQNKNIFISGLGYYPNALDSNKEQAEKSIEHIKQVIRAAAKLGIPVVNTFIGADPVKSLDDNFKLFEDRWPAIIKVAEENNIKIGIENCPMLFTRDEWPSGKNLAYSPRIWRRMFESIPHPLFGLNYDPSHLVWMQMDEVQPLYEFKERIHHVHLKDAKVYKDKLNEVGILAYPLDFHQPKLPGLGDVRWRDFFSALTTIRYKGPVCIEVEDRAFESSAADIETSILTARNFLSQFLVIK